MAVGEWQRLVADLNELAVTTQRAGGGNPIALFNLADILAKDLQKKDAPEAYLIYALYDQDSNRYEVGKKVLTRNAANQHEVLKENMYITKDGYMETFVVNETSEDVWFDNLMVSRVSSAIVQETHYDPWGLELTGLGYQYGGIKANKYLYNGNETLSDLNLNLYDFKSRFYDPAIGRFISIDVLADHPRQIGTSPYQFSWNNPIRYNDPDGKCPSCWPMLYAAYQGMKAKYSGVLSQANAPSQRLISGTSGNTPSNIGMNETTRSAIKITGVASDINAVTEVGKTFAKEATMDVGNALDKGGEVISDVGVALAIPTEGASLVLVPVGEGASMLGKSMKAGIHLSNGNVQGAVQEGVNLAVGAITSSATGAAIQQSKKVGLISNPIQEYTQKAALGVVESGVNKTSGLINENVQRRDEEEKR
jgi:RHS repeat-associated protein